MGTLRAVTEKLTLTSVAIGRALTGVGDDGAMVEVAVKPQPCTGEVTIRDDGGRDVRLETRHAFELDDELKDPFVMYFVDATVVAVDRMEMDVIPGGATVFVANDPPPAS